MPVAAMVCDSDSILSTAIRDSLKTKSISSISTSSTSDHIGFNDHLVASAKRVLLTPIEYREDTDYKNTVLTTLQTKYVVLTPPNKTNLNGNSNQHKPDNSKEGGTSQNGKQQLNSGSGLPRPKRILFPKEQVHIGWKSTTSNGRVWQVGAGMNNLGNTCYLNSTLQALFHVPAFANWLYSDKPHREKCESTSGIQGGCIICAMAKTLISSQNSQQSIKPILICTKLRMICKHFVYGQQEDAHEFLKYLIEAMEKAYLMRHKNWKEFDQFSKETTPLNQIFGGYLKSSVRCLSCGHISITFQHFEDILLDIRKANTLDEALGGYFARERLEDMGYKCESCKKKVSATKQFSIERAPIVLCIQLKRFNGNCGKINKHISIRPTLSLAPYSAVKGSNGHTMTYRLVSLVTHLGSSQHCGHYTAIGCTSSGGYYQFDDSSVRAINIQNVLSTNSYIMFYELISDGTIPNGMPAAVKQVSSTITLKESQANNMNGNGKPEETKKIIGPMLPSFTDSVNNLYANGKTPKVEVVQSNGINENGKPKAVSPSVTLPPKPIINVKSNNLSNGTKPNNNTTIHFKVKPNEGPSKLKENESGIKQISSPVKILQKSNSEIIDKSPNNIGVILKSTPNKKPLQVINAPRLIEESSLKDKPKVPSLLTINNNTTKILSNNVKKQTTSPEEYKLQVQNKLKRLVPYESDEESTSSRSSTSSKKLKLSVPKKQYEEETIEIIKTDAGPWQVTSLNPIKKSENSEKLSAIQTPFSKNSVKQNGNAKLILKLKKSENTVKIEKDETVGQLLAMSHRGYGSKVLSWNGQKSEMDKEVLNEKEDLKKIDDEFEEEIIECDRGKTKKVRLNFVSERDNPGYNPFQEHQNTQASNRRWITNGRHVGPVYRQNPHGKNNGYRNRFKFNFHNGGRR